MSIRIADHVSIDRAEIDEDVEIGPFCVIGPKAASAAARDWKTASP